MIKDKQTYKLKNPRKKKKFEQSRNKKKKKEMQNLKPIPTIKLVAYQKQINK